jgi:glycopeptide antibiotics resistance protein
MLIIQEILGYFFIGIIGMAILAVCYLPIYFIMRKRMPLLRQIAYFLFIVCVLVISTATFLDWVIICLLDGRAIFATEHSLNLIPFRFITETWDMGVRKQITQTIANILMFLPLGFIFPVAFKKARTFYKTTICMLLFSFLIEFVQYFIGRSADIDDLILNTSGAMLGYFLFYKLSKLFKNKNVWKKLNGTAS